MKPLLAAVAILVLAVVKLRRDARRWQDWDADDSEIVEDQLFVPMAAWPLPMNQRMLDDRRAFNALITGRTLH